MIPVVELVGGMCVTTVKVGSSSVLGIGSFTLVSRYPSSRMTFRESGAFWESDGNHRKTFGKTVENP